MKENIIKTMLKATEDGYFDYNTQVEYLGDGKYLIKSNDNTELITDSELIEIFENYPPELQQELLESYGE